MWQDDFREAFTTAYELIDGPPERLLLCYDKWQPMYATLTETITKMKFVEDFRDPDLSMRKRGI